MSLINGTRLGPYEIVALLGAGGMGEVYKARDTRLDRTVAIKILLEHASSDQPSRERFEREAKVISNLDHPHICALYDVGLQDGIDFLVMPFLEGETLAQRVQRGALPVEQVLRFGVEIADALDKAHREGIIHRDLKPGNVMVTKAGTKLLDFGLAKLRPAAAGAAATLSQAPTGASPLTSQGSILGTLHYMAPEQLEGKDADVRSDIFAFGAVLYEMTTGRRAFDGKSTASVIAAILEREPTPITLSQPLAPPLLDHVIKRCLAKEPDDRWQTAGDVMRELRWIAEGTALPVVVTPLVSRKRRAVPAPIIAAIAGLMVGAVLTFLMAGRFQHTANDTALDVTRSLIAVAPADYLQANAADHSISQGHLSRRTMALSPDGRTIVFSAVHGDRQQLYMRRLDQLEATAIAGSEEGASPFISPDGKWVGFWAKGTLKKAPLGGEGAVTTICETTAIFGATWSSDDVIIFDRETGGLRQIAASGGVPKALTMLDASKGEFSHRLPQILPGNKAVMFTITRSLLPTWDDTDVVVQSLATNERKVIVQGGADGNYVPSGHLLYVRRGTLMAAPFSIQTQGVTGGSTSVITDLMQSANMPSSAWDSGAGQFTVSQSGSLAYLPGGIYSFPDRSLVWVDRSGRIERFAADPRVYIYPRLSPDGKQVLVSTQGDRNVWVYDILRGTTTRLTTDGRNMAATWTPDGKRVIFGSSTAGAENLFWKSADNSAASERLTTSQNNQRAAFLSSDGKVLFFTEVTQPGNTDIWALPLTDNHQARPVVNTRFDEQYPALSPDGQWLAYASDESGRSEVYVQQYPGPGPKVPISTDGGSAPAWTKDGRELFYLAPVASPGSPQYRMMAVNVTTRPAFAAEKPRLLFQVPFGSNANVRGYDVSPDGQRFLMVQPNERATLKPANIVFVQNWFEELKRRVPAR